MARVKALTGRHHQNRFGWEVCSIRLLEQETGKHVRIVAMTASAHEADRQACIVAGMDDFLSKPIKPSELAIVLGQYRKVELIALSMDAI